MKLHYSILYKLPFILKSGILKKSTVGVPRLQEQAVWFSSNPVHEPTAGKVFERALNRTLTFAEQCQAAKMSLDYTPVRICVGDEVAPYTWEDYIRISGISPQLYKCMKKVAYEQGAKPSEWFVSFEPVPSVKWKSIEWFREGGWKQIEPEALGILKKDIAENPAKWEKEEAEFDKMDTKLCLGF